MTASNYGQAGGVTETLPAGFTYVSSNLMSAGQVEELPGNVVRFILQGDTSFTYTVTAATSTGAYDFTGMLRDDDKNDHVVGGASRVIVPAKAGPARRSFSPATVTPGGRVKVTIAATGYGPAGGITEWLPAGVQLCLQQPGRLSGDGAERESGQVHAAR